MKIQTFEYLNNEKSFLDEIKNIVHSFWRAIIWWKIKNWKKIADTSFNQHNWSRKSCTSRFKKKEWNVILGIWEWNIHITHYYNFKYLKAHYYLQNIALFDKTDNTLYISCFATSNNILVVKALDSQSRGPGFKTTGWLQG